jgi:hypothetical protein
MKISKTILASAVLAGATVTGLQADSVSVSNQVVTLALTSKSFVGGTFEVGEDGKLTKTPAFESTVETLDKNGNPTRVVVTNAARAVAGRLGNKELLESIKDDLLDGSITGWSIQLSQTEDEGFVAVKSGQDPVSLSDVISANFEGVGGAYSVVQTTTNRYTGEELTSSVATVTGRGTDEGPVSFGITTPAGEVAATGLYVAPWTLLQYYPDSTDKSVVESAYIPGAGRVTGIVGSASTEDASALIGGTISLAAARGTVNKD